MAGLDKLVEFLLNIIEKLLPIFILHPYEQGIQYWCGKYLRTIGPGIWWKVPFLDTVDKDIVVTSTLTIPAQSLTTKDGRQIVVKSMVRYNIFDIKLFLLSVTDRTDAISDTAQCIIKEQITQRNWEACADNQLDNIITRKLRNEIKRWGIDVEKFTITDIGLIRSIRLFNETSNIING